MIFSSKNYNWSLVIGHWALGIGHWASGIGPLSPFPFSPFPFSPFPPTKVGIYRNSALKGMA
ncbi:hypothetical protein VF07_36910 [Nostoc linckia z6]|nr:hypothetical protein VF07_36910 [Nostoc linckia z6]